MFHKIHFYKMGFWQRIFLSSILLLQLFHGQAQKQSYNWFFGDHAGLDFNSGSPVFQSGALSTNEGCSSISDKDGHLLFYTDGTTVWNKNHTVMPNGTGLYGGGTGSTSQSSLIVPHPGNDSIFYLFTLDESNNIFSNKGFRYSIVNMRLDNGNGNITTVKNVQLLPAYQKEMLAGIVHSNGKDVWILTHQNGNNIFNEFKITVNGLNTTPVSVAVGASFYSYTDHGYLRFSPDGKKLAAAFTGHHVELFDFNTTTGAITNPRIIPPYLNTSCSVYGVEFSCDSKLLYVSEVPDCQSTTGYAILQYNSEFATATAITASRVLLDQSTTAKQVGALQMGADNKIYITYTEEGFIGAITRPGVAGTGCGYVKQYLNLPATAHGRYGLPNFVQSYFNTPVDFTFNYNCGSLTVPFQLTLNAIDSVRWDFGDPASGTANSTGSMNPVHMFSANGQYAVMALAYRACRVDTIRKLITAGSFKGVLGNDTTVCEKDTVKLKPAVISASYRWQNSSIADSFVVRSAGTYWVDISLGSCMVRDSIQVGYKPLPVLNQVLDQSICGNEFPATIGQNITAASYQWSTGATTPFIAVTAPGSYSVTATVNGCSARKTAVVTAKPVTVFTLGNDTTICDGSPTTINSSLPTLLHQWNTGERSASIVVTGAGIYWDEATNQSGCRYRDSIVVSTKPLPVFSLGNDTTICEGATLPLNVTGAGDGFLWQDFSTTPFYTVTKEGRYYVDVSLAGCKKRDEIQVTIDAIPRPNLGPDWQICTGEQLQLDPRIAGTAYLWQDGSTARTLTAHAAGTYNVTVTNHCGAGSDEVKLSLVPCAVEFPNAFTPNGNGVNDKFGALHATGITGYHLRVFNRFGQLVFETRNASKGWDGTLAGQVQPQGVYVFAVEFVDHRGQQVARKGTVVLIR